MMAGRLGCLHHVGDEFFVLAGDHAELGQAVSTERAGECFQRLVDAVERSLHRAGCLRAFAVISRWLARLRLSKAFTINASQPCVTLVVVTCRSEVT